MEAEFVRCKGEEPLSKGPHRHINVLQNPAFCILCASQEIEGLGREASELSKALSKFKPVLEEVMSEGKRRLERCSRINEGGYCTGWLYTLSSGEKGLL